MIANDKELQVTLPTLSIDTFDYSRREGRPRLGVEPRLLRGAEE